LGTRDAEMLTEQLVNQKVLGLRVKEMGIDVAEDELESEIAAFLKQQNISREEFERVLAQEGETVESHREEFRTQLETQRFIGRVIRPLVTVTEDEVRNYYMQQSGAAANPAQTVRLRSLVINLPTDLAESQRQAKQERVSAIRKEVDTGGSFASMVKLYSESPDALKTEGLLPPRPVRELPKELQGAIKETKPGQVVGPLQLGSSVFFFEFLGFEASDSKEFETQKAQWENRLLETKFKERLDDYVRAERTKSKVVRRPITFRR
jgi:peptidyl-prolyl cis-trans isomerase SurA